jgi:hypothetical protein
MKPIDVTVPLDPDIPDSPCDTAFSFEPIKPADGTPPRVVLRKS